MSRMSTNKLAGDGTVLHGYDYGAQVWVSFGIVLRCGHPDDTGECCNARRYAGCLITEVPGHDSGQQEAV